MASNHFRRLPSGDLSVNRTCLLLIAPPPFAGAPANSVRLFIEFVFPVTLGQASRTCAMLALRSSADRLFPGRSLMASLLTHMHSSYGVAFLKTKRGPASPLAGPLSVFRYLGRKFFMFVCYQTMRFLFFASYVSSSLKSG